MKKFTLIELLVVVAIIGILLSILLPSLYRAREMSKRAVCKSNMNQIHKMINIYALQHNKRISLGMPNGEKYQNTYFFAGRPDRMPFNYYYYYAADLIDAPEAWTCPSQTSEGFLFNSSANRWPPLNGSTKTRSSYSNRAKLRGAKNRSFPMLDRLESQVIMSDVVTNRTALNLHHVQGTNVMALDGSVHWVVHSVFKTHMDTFINFNTSNNNNWVNMFKKFESNIGLN